MRALIPLGAVIALAGCDQLEDSGPITVSVIARAIQMADPSRVPPDEAGSVLLGATAQGLVSFNVEGQVEAGLAQRWILTDDGLSLIFRIRRATWPDGKEVTAAHVVARLNAALAPGSRNRLRPLFGAVERIIPMTGQVVEFRLRRSEPELLQLLAQPEMAIFRLKPSQGTGPYRIHSVRGGITRLRPVPLTDEEAKAPADDRNDIRLHGEKTSMAIARFAAGDAMLVTGGHFSDLPLVRAARSPTNQFHIDPAYGLFGLGISAGSKPLASPALRRALAMAIDRERLGQMLGVNRWVPLLSILPNQLDSIAPPAASEWVQLELEARQQRAREIVSGNGAIPVLSVALPEGPGARLLFAALAADWRKIGVRVRRVRMRDPSDLRLIDEIAPQSGALWYLHRLSCTQGLPCDSKAEQSLNAVQAAADAEAKTKAIAEADVAFASHQPYIPIALPLRWSLVAPQLNGWRASPFAQHPLRRMRMAEQ